MIRVLLFLVQGRVTRRGYLVTRITVTLSIFNFSTRFFAQIVENRETQLSSLFLGPGDIFPTIYNENRFLWQLYGGFNPHDHASDPTRAV